MRLACALLLVVAIGSCSKGDPLKDANDRLAIAQKVGNKTEVCKQARAIADIYLDRKDQQNYQGANAEANLLCLAI